MHRTTTLLLAAATSAATSKLLAKTLGESESVVRASAQIAKRDLQALEAHVYATGVDLCDHPLFRLAHGVPRDNHNTAVLPA